MKGLMMRSRNWFSGLKYSELVVRIHGAKAGLDKVKGECYGYASLTFRQGALDYFTTEAFKLAQESELDEPQKTLLTEEK